MSFYSLILSLFEYGLGLNQVQKVSTWAMAGKALFGTQQHHTCEMLVTGKQSVVSCMDWTKKRRSIE
jgi:hypothetical protein